MYSLCTTIALLLATPLATPHHAVDVLAETIKQQPPERQIELLEQLISSHENPWELTEVIRYLNYLRELDIVEHEVDHEPGAMDFDFVEGMGGVLSPDEHREIEVAEGPRHLWLTDTKGQQIQIAELRFDSTESLVGELCSYDGCDQGRLEIPVDRIERVMIFLGSDVAVAEVWTRGGEPRRVQLSPATSLHADSSFGRVQLTLRDVEEITLR